VPWAGPFVGRLLTDDVLYPQRPIGPAVTSAASPAASPGTPQVFRRCQRAAVEAP